MPPVGNAVRLAKRTVRAGLSLLRLSLALAWSLAGVLFRWSHQAVNLFGGIGLRWWHRARNRLMAIGRRAADRGRRAATSGLRLRQYEGRPLRIPQRYTRGVPPADPPRISIVTPSLNQADYVERTIRSVVEQGYEPLEYIVQDGGSTDGTRQILERYADRLYHWESAPDSGQASAINAGFERATGDVLAWLNADDVLLPASLAYVGSFLSRHPDVDALYAHRVLLDADDREIGRWVLPRHDEGTLRWADYVPQETLFWTRRIWERVGGHVDERFGFAIDWDLLLRFQDAGARIVRVPRFLAGFRVHDDQKTMRILEDVGYREMGILRERVHGRPVSSAEVARALAPFFVRQIVYRTLYRGHVLRY